MVEGKFQMDAKDFTLIETVEGKSEFCKIWPTVKQGLEMLKAMVKNPLAKAAIEAVIVAGTAIAKSICG
jgi:hypothetical protein